MFERLWRPGVKPAIGSRGVPADLSAATEPASTRLLVLVGALPASSGLNSTPCGILKNLKFAIGQVRPQSKGALVGWPGLHRQLSRTNVPAGAP